MTNVKELYGYFVNGHNLNTEQLLDLINDVIRHGTVKQLEELAEELEHCPNCFTELNHKTTCHIKPYQDGFSVCPSCGYRRD